MNFVGLVRSSCGVRTACFRRKYLNARQTISQIWWHYLLVYDSHTPRLSSHLYTVVIIVLVEYIFSFSGNCMAKTCKYLIDAFHFVELLLLTTLALLSSGMHII
uniref:MIP03431p n=1 Tax=Drosophila melanogaster TaxID=7227 RepID=C8VV54_DROME|nr:MIP03731p [Drosophila melanogaster]ACV91661.1 MIP03431p [Drosophila melanogaster]